MTELHGHLNRVRVIRTDSVRIRGESGREVGGERRPAARGLRRLANQLRHRVERVGVVDRHRDPGDPRREGRVRKRILRRVDQQIAALVESERGHVAAAAARCRLPVAADRLCARVAARDDGSSGCCRVTAFFASVVSTR